MKQSKLLIALVQLSGAAFAVLLSQGVVNDSEQMTSGELMTLVESYGLGAFAGTILMAIAMFVVFNAKKKKNPVTWPNVFLSALAISGVLSSLPLYYFESTVANHLSILPSIVIALASVLVWLLSYRNFKTLTWHRS